MKRLSVIIMCCILILSFAGCASKTNTGNNDINNKTSEGYVTKEEYEQLEKRIAELEHNLDNLYSVKFNSVGPYFDPDNTSYDNNNKDNNAIENAPTETTDLYLLDKMSAEEIFEECKLCLSNAPNEGQAFDDYLNSFKSPLSFTYMRNDSIYGDTYDFKRSDIRDSMAKIIIGGMYPFDQMDGSRIFAKSTYLPLFIGIELWLYDYEKAVDVFDKLSDYLKPNYRDVLGNRNGTSWYYEGYVKESDSPYDYVSITKLEKNESRYIIQAYNYY